MAARYAFSNSPLKKAKSSAPASDNFDVVGEPIPDRFCPDSDCGPPPGWMVKKRYQGRRYACCSNNNKAAGANSCTFTANIFGSEGKTGGDSKIACFLCSVPVVDVLSLGSPSGKKDPATNKQGRITAIMAMPS